MIVSSRGFDKRIVDTFSKNVFQHLTRFNYLKSVYKGDSMKTILSVFVLLFSFQSSFAAETRDKNFCQKQYGDDVSTCFQGLDAQGIKGPTRAEANKTCIKNAKAGKEACENGPSQCVTTCQNTYNTSSATCNSSYTTDVANCGDNILCSDIANQVKLDCLSAAQSDLNSCTASCQ